MKRRFIKILEWLYCHPYYFLGVLAFLSGLFWACKYSGPLLKEAVDYDGLGWSLLKNKMFGYPNEGPVMRREPGYPAFLALVYLFFGHNNIAAIFVQIFLFCGVVLFVYWIGQVLLNRILAIVASILTAIFPPLATFVGRIYSEIFFTFLFILWVVFFIKALKSSKKLLFFVSAVIYGFLVLTKVITFYFIPFILIYLFFVFYKQNIKKALMVMLIFFIGAMSIIFPWMLRNRYYFNTYSITERGGWLLWVRAYPTTFSLYKYGQYVSAGVLGDYVTLKIFPDYSGDYEDLAYAPSCRRLTELDKLGFVRRDAENLLMKEAVFNILHHPFLYAFGSIVEIFKFNTPMNPHFPIFHMFVETHYEIPSWLKIIIILSIRLVSWLFFAVIIYGIYKSFCKKEDFRKIGFVSVVVIVFNLLHSLVDTIPRYSLPLYPLYFILFCYGLRFIFYKLNYFRDNQSICAE
jgi:4-amino-4-deoxy-L-arabinose transferase-like glycosyltransferase